MTDARPEAVLQNVARRQSQSLLQYVGDSFPWTKAEGRDGLRKLRAAFEEDRRAVTTLTQYLTRRKWTVPQLGVFPASFTTINFVALDYLLPQLVDAQRAEIAALEGDLDALGDDPAREPVQELLAMKRRHLEELGALGAGTAAPAVI